MEENKQNQALNEEELKQVHGGIATEITALSDYLFGWECPTCGKIFNAPRDEIHQHKNEWVPDGFKNFAERPLRIMRKEIKGDPIQSSEYDDPGARTVRPYN